jgi:hypothetical protein
MGITTSLTVSLINVSANSNCYTYTVFVTVRAIGLACIFFQILTNSYRLQFFDNCILVSLFEAFLSFWDDVRFEIVTVSGSNCNQFWAVNCIRMEWISLLETVTASIVMD